MSNDTQQVDPNSLRVVSQDNVAGMGTAAIAAFVAPFLVQFAANQGVTVSLAEAILAVAALQGLITHLVPARGFALRLPVAPVSALPPAAAAQSVKFDIDTGLAKPAP